MKKLTLASIILSMFFFSSTVFAEPVAIPQDCSGSSCAKEADTMHKSMHKPGKDSSVSTDDYTMQ